MSDAPRRTFGQDFRLFFLRGLVVLLPSVLTLWIIVKAYQFVDDTIAEPINAGVRWVILQATPHLDILDGFEPTEDQIAAERRRIRETGRPTPEDAILITALTRENIREWWEGFALGFLDLIGIMVAITIVYFAGRLLGGFFGRRVYRRVEKALISIPVVKQVYPYVKQVVDFLFGEDKPLEFKRVVLVEYPRKGIFSIGLLTGSALKSVSQKANIDSVTVFIPSSPTPFTGYTITIPRSEALDLPISIDEALRFTISGGVLMPDRETLPPGVDPTRIEQPGTPGPGRSAGGPIDSTNPSALRGDSDES